MSSDNEKNLNKLVIDNIETLEQSILTAKEIDQNIYKALDNEFKCYFDNKSYELYSSHDSDESIYEWQITAKKNSWDNNRKNKKDSDGYPIFFILFPKNISHHQFILSSLLGLPDPDKGQETCCGIYFKFNRFFFNFKGQKESIEYLLNKFEKLKELNIPGVEKFEFVQNEFIEYGIFIPFLLNKEDLKESYSPSGKEYIAPFTEILKIITKDEVMAIFDEIAEDLGKRYIK